MLKHISWQVCFKTPRILCFVFLLKFEHFTHVMFHLAASSHFLLRYKPSAAKHCVHTSV